LGGVVADEGRGVARISACFDWQQQLVAAINAVAEPQEIVLALPELRCAFGDRSLVLDISVFVWERLFAYDDGTVANSFTAPPDWAIEILSPGQSSTRVTSHLLHCLSYGRQPRVLLRSNERREG